MGACDPELRCAVRHGFGRGLAQEVEPGTAPERLRPSAPLALSSEVCFYDPARDAIAFPEPEMAPTWPKYWNRGPNVKLRLDDT